MFKTFAEYKAAMLARGAESVGAVDSKKSATPTKDLAEAVSREMKSRGLSDDVADVAKVMEAKAAGARMETKANEVMHTSNTGFGAELVPGNVLTTDFLDLAPASSPLLAFFSAGFHGRNLDKKADVAVIGEVGLHKLVPEWTTGSPVDQIGQGIGRVPTAKVTIEQKERWFTIDLSEHETRFATVVDVIALAKAKLAASAANTIISDIINGDTTTAGTGNVNSVDAAPAADESFLAADGLVKTSFDQSNAFDAGTFEFADYLALMKALGVNAANREDNLFLHSMGAELSAMGIAEFKQAYLNGSLSTVMTGKLPKFLSSQVAVDRWLKEGNAAGKVSATPANNTKGRIVYANKYAVQHGSNGDYMIEIFRVPGRGYQVIGYYFYGHAIASKLAGGDATVATLYNIG